MSRLGGIDQRCTAAALPLQRRCRLMDCLQGTHHQERQGSTASRGGPGQHCDFGQEPSQAASFCPFPKADEDIPLAAVLMPSGASFHHEFISVSGSREQGQLCFLGEIDVICITAAIVLLETPPFLSVGRRGTLMLQRYGPRGRSFFQEPRLIYQAWRVSRV